MRLADRVAIVTGAGGGLGRAHALYLARQDARLVVNDVCADNAARVTDEITAVGGEATPYAASVTDEDAVAAMVEAFLARFGRIDILINNAGILRDKSFAKMTIADFRTVVDIYLIGAAICSKAVWDTMRSVSFGRIVMTTSSSGLYGNFGQANDGAARMALVGLMQTLAIEGEKYGISVNALAPTAAIAMTRGVLSDDGLRLLDAALVRPGLLALVGDDVPTRAILCESAGHFATAHVTLSEGIQSGDGPDAGEQVAARWSDVADRAHDIVPAYGFMQAEREAATAGKNSGSATPNESLLSGLIPQNIKSRQRFIGL